MKQTRFIFFAVAAMCFFMVMTLPRLAHSTASASAPAAGGVAQALAPTEALPVVPIDIAPAAADTTGQDVARTAPTALPAVVEATPLPVIEGEPVDAPIPAAAPPVESGIPASAVAAEDFPTLEEFAASLITGQADQVVGYYAPGLSALPVRQQPAGNNDYISDEYGTATQYSKPGQYGVVGLLAHNTLSGREFFYLGQNQDIFLVYGDGHTARYRIQHIQEYQALSPYDTRSDFVDLSNPSGPVLSHSEVFQRVYTQPGTLVLQTCIEANGEPTWGRLFVIAEPL